MPDQPIPDVNNLKNVNKELEIIQDSLTSIGVQLQQKIQEAFENIEDSTKTVSEIYAKNLDKSIKGMARNSETILKNTLGILSGQNKSKDIDKQLQNLQVQQLAAQRNIRMLKRNGLIDDVKMKELQGNLTEQYQAQQKLLTSQLQLTDEISSKVGLLGKLLGETSKIPILGKFIDGESALAKMNATAAAGGGKLKVLGAGISVVGKSLAKNLLDPVSMITFFVAQANKADKQITLLALFVFLFSLSVL
jgi:hypothetical protein